MRATAYIVLRPSYRKKVTRYFRGGLGIDVDNYFVALPLRNEHILQVKTEDYMNMYVTNILPSFQFSHPGSN